MSFYTNYYLFKYVFANCKCKCKFANVICKFQMSFFIKFSLFFQACKSYCKINDRKKVYPKLIMQDDLQD